MPQIEKSVRELPCSFSFIIIVEFRPVKGRLVPQLVVVVQYHLPFVIILCRPAHIIMGSTSFLLSKAGVRVCCIYQARYILSSQRIEFIRLYVSIRPRGQYLQPRVPLGHHGMHVYLSTLGGFH